MREIDNTQAQQLIDYLVERPYKEVYQLVHMILELTLKKDEITSEGTDKGESKKTD